MAEPGHPAIKRLGVFGGAFDPPHKAHLALVQAALAQLQLDQIKVIPTGQAWHKTRSLSPAVDRLAMAELAFGSLAGVEVDPREMRRPGPSFTVDTLRELQLENPQAELFLLIGADQARALPTWHQWQALVQSAIICVAEREDLTRANARFVPPDQLKSRFARLKMPPSPISATAIRTAVSNGQDVSPLVGEPVARYIVDHHLFQTP
jgi:nicotinate-nucleotide adenylyltransferase